MFYQIDSDIDWTKFIKVIVNLYDNEKEMNWKKFLKYYFVEKFNDQNKFENMGDYLLDLIKRNSNK